MRRRPTTAVLAALLAALLVTQSGCGADSSESSAKVSGCVTGDDPHRAVESVLERRTTAVREDDREAFMATVDPHADDEMVAEQEAWFDRVHALPEHTIELSLDRIASDDGLTTSVTHGVQLAGIDLEPVEVDHRVTFVRPGGCWLVTADEPDPAQVAGAPWDFPGSVVEQRDGVIVVTDLTSHADRTRVLDSAAAAWDRTRRLLASSNRRPDDAGVVVMAFASPKAMEALGYEDEDLELTGGATGTADQGEGDVRVIVSPAMIDIGAEDGLPSLLRHEFTHVLLAHHWRTPLWVTEGVAEFYSTSDAEMADQLASSRTRGVGLPDQDFYDLNGARRRGNYAVSWAAMRVIAREHGEAEPARLVRVLDAVTSHHFPSRVERILGERYGLSTDELGVRAREYLDDLT